MESKNITSEKVIEDTFNHEVKKLGGISIKLLTSLVSGLPDRMALLPEGRVFFVELKSRGKKPEKIQMYWHNKLRGLGFDAYVIDNLETLQTVMQKYAR